MTRCLAAFLFFSAGCLNPVNVGRLGTGTSGSGGTNGSGGRSGGSSGGACAVLEPNPLNFGTVPVGQVATATLTYTNCSASSETVSMDPITGPNATDFMMTSSGSATLAPGQSVTVTVAFRPTGPGSASAALPFSNCLGCTAQVVSLLGSGSGSSGATGGGTSTGGSSSGGSSGSGGAGGVGSGCTQAGDCQNSLECSVNHVCCVAGGGGCIGSPDCCSGYCASGTCQCNANQHPNACASDADCCSGTACDLVTGICCNSLGGTCSQQSDCCNGVCSGSPGSPGTCQCASAGYEGCESATDCCAPAKCSGGLCCVPGGGACPQAGSGYGCCSQQCDAGVCTCGSAGGFCTGDSDCCSGFVCAGSSSFGSNVKTCCVANSGGCNSPSDCCSGSCVNGTCGCLTQGQQCNSNADCCTGGICKPIGPTGGGGPNLCCQASGSPCNVGSECCSQTCTAGVCG